MGVPHLPVGGGVIFALCYVFICYSPGVPVSYPLGCVGMMVFKVINYLSGLSELVLLVLNNSSPSATKLCFGLHDKLVGSQDGTLRNPVARVWGSRFVFFCFDLCYRKSSSLG